ncbi:MAG: hypothetical protein KGJ60_09735 [Verrucomicrobiota bacterium]|nr:hypothetical protein [Verrucomicrobiota bacterium]
MTIALAAGAVSSGAAPPEGPVAPNSVPIVAKTPPRWHSPLTPARQPAVSPRIERLGHVSSQAWATIASRSGGASPFLSAEMQQPKMYLAWFGHEPWR